MNALPAFLLLYVALYAAYGVEGPFLTALLYERGMSAETIAFMLAAGTALRLVSAPLAAAIADRFGAQKTVLGMAILASAVVGCGFGLTSGFAALFVVSMLHAAMLAPINPLSDALAIRAATAHPESGSRLGRGFDYGFVRGMGSAAFIVGATIAGPVVAGWGLSSVVWLAAVLLVLAAVAVPSLPRLASGSGAAMRSAEPAPAPRREPGAIRALLALPAFRLLLLVSGLVQGSHALYGAFATLSWQAAGVGPEAIGLLWSVAVASEVLMVLVLGQPLMARIGPAGLSALAAAAGVLRWTVMASTSWLPAQFLVQPLHGLTFAAQHLAVMRLLAEAVPARFAGTAHGVHASFGPGLAGAFLTLAAGPLYANFGADGYWAMAALCAVALPASFALAPVARRAAAAA